MDSLQETKCEAKEGSFKRQQHKNGGVRGRLSSDSHEGEQCLLEELLVKLSREQSISLADVMLSQRSDKDSPSLTWSSPLDVEIGRSSFGILGYGCTQAHRQKQLGP